MPWSPCRASRINSHRPPPSPLASSCSHWWLRWRRTWMSKVYGCPYSPAIMQEWHLSNTRQSMRWLMHGMSNMRAAPRASTSEEISIMLRRQGKKEAPQDVMSRQETAIWLGRAMSTSEVTLRVVLELLDVVAFQQAVIEQFYEQRHTLPAHDNSQPSEPSLDFEPGTSQKIVEKLTHLREELDPVLKTVEDACQRFEKMIHPT